MNHRLDSDYQPDWDIDMRVGRQGELFVKRIRDGLEDGTVEVKTDEKHSLTGNVYIERFCRRQGEWKPSGIQTTKATTWAFVLSDQQIMIAVPVPVLRALSDRAVELGMEKECPRGSHPTMGVVVPDWKLLQWATAISRDVAA